MKNYFNSLSLRKKLKQLNKCRLMQKEEFIDSIEYLKNKKIVIIGCGAQGLNQGLNMRDSGLDVSYVLSEETISNKGLSWHRACKNDFYVGHYLKLIPEADLIINLTPDKQHSTVIKSIQPLMKIGSTLGYSHGFNIVEVGEYIRSDITVIMVAPKCPGTEVRKEYQRGFGVPALIAVHEENDPNNMGIILAKSWATAIGSDRAGVLESSFIAEVKSDLMGEQTVLCGMLQTASIFCFEQMISNGIKRNYACKLIQYGWEIITEALKQGGITLMMDRLNNHAKLRAFNLSIKIKNMLRPLFEKHMDDIMDGSFSKQMILDWQQGDVNLLNWRNKMQATDFEHVPEEGYSHAIQEQEYFDHGILMVAIIKASVELSFEIMTDSGIAVESAYYESLHELPLIANTIARKRLYEMNKIISDTAEYGNYLFTHTALTLFRNNNFDLHIEDLGKPLLANNSLDNISLRDVNSAIRQHPIEITGTFLRNQMKHMKNTPLHN